MRSNKLILTVGFPRSGKSTWARMENYPIVNPDAIRLALHGQRFYAPAEPMVWVVAHIMVESLFAAGAHVVVLDSCNNTRKRRDEWKSDLWFRSYELVSTPADECRRRALLNDDSEILPVIDRMEAEFEEVQKEE